MPTAPKNAASPAPAAAPALKDPVSLAGASAASSLLASSEASRTSEENQNAGWPAETGEFERNAPARPDPSSAAGKEEPEREKMSNEGAVPPPSPEGLRPEQRTTNASETDTKQPAPSPLPTLASLSSLAPSPLLASVSGSLASPKNAGTLEEAAVPGKRRASDDAGSPSASRKRLRKPDENKEPNNTATVAGKDEAKAGEAKDQTAPAVSTAEERDSTNTRRLRAVPEESEEREESEEEEDEDEEEGNRDDPTVIAEDADSAAVSQRLLVGTHTSSGDGNSLLVLQVSLPAKPIEDEASRAYVERPTDYDGFSFGMNPCKFKTVKSFPHDGEVNVARYMPQKPDIVATMGPQGFVYVYDVSRVSATSGGALLRLPAHSTDGFGLAWNSLVEGRVASTSNGGTICLHDVQAALASSAAGAPLRTFTASKSAVNDCCWMADDASLLATCGDDGVVSLWDARDDSSNAPAVQLKASETDLLTCLCGDEKQPNTVVCGDNRGTLRVFDRRRGEKPVHTIEAAHQGEVTRVAFSPSQSGLLCSASRDRFVSLWDLRKVGEEQSEEDAEDGPPELLFSHGGHVAAVSDVAWNREDLASLEKVVASVGEDNRLQIWQLKHSVFCDDASDDDNDDDDDDVE
uniref:WD40 repeat containing protein n=1 Tax=Neospora caninum (strain Liverpool) TaxID=572307 RepID=A0A0F7URE7_NEOCL|nr:TPA: WD40 repeat containing protein [Neospora caninum Liverpool]